MKGAFLALSPQCSSSPLIIKGYYVLQVTQFDKTYRMCIRVARLTGMSKKITDTVNLDGVKEASSSADVYSEGMKACTDCSACLAASNGLS